MAQSEGNEPPQACNWLETVEPGLESLAVAYDRAIELFTEEHRALLESGELGGFKDGDSERAGRQWKPALFRLQDMLWERLMGRSERVACIVLAFSPSTEQTLKDYDAPEGAAVAAAALDVLRVALERGWYKPQAGEDPSAETLKLAA